MPAIAKDKQEFYKSRIRALVSVDHQMTNVMLLEKLQAEGINMDRDFLSKLLGKVYRERVKRADRQTLAYALASFEDTMIQVVKVAWEIAQAPYINPQARVMALREIREAHSAVFEKLFDAGVFERKLGTLDATIRNTPLPEERKQAIRAVFTNWGLLEAPKEDAQPTSPPAS